MKHYLLNTPILTDYGNYEFKQIDVDLAKKMLQADEYESAIGHESTAAVMADILETDIFVSRIQVKMETGDKAIVFRLLTRLPEGKVLTEQELKELPYELGVLKKIS